MEALSLVVNTVLMVMLLLGIKRADKTGDGNEVGLFSYAEKRVTKKSSQRTSVTRT